MWTIKSMENAMQWYDEAAMIESVKQGFKTAAPILISALAAAAFAGAQSLAAHAGICPSSPTSIADTGALGGIIKAGHTLYTSLINNGTTA